MTRRGNPTQIGGLIRNITSQLVAGQPLYAIWQVWEGATGEVVAKHARPVRLRDGLLIVAVDSSTWMQELHYLKPQLCTKLTEAVPEAAVKDLYFVLREDDSEPASRPILKGEDRLPPPPRIAHPSSPTSPEAARGKPLDDILKRWLEVARKGRRES